MVHMQIKFNEGNDLKHIFLLQSLVVLKKGTFRVISCALSSLQHFNNRLVTFCESRHSPQHSASLASLLLR